MSPAEQLSVQIESLSPAERFRFVADLLEAKRPGLALSLARRTTAELGAWMILVHPSPGQEGS